MAAGCLVLSSLTLGAMPPAGSQAAPPACEAPAAERSISYLGVTRGVANLAGAGLGQAGSWFPQVDAPSPVEGRPTGERVRDALPTWIAPLRHVPQDPDFGARTFSQDGPARSAGGRPGWATLTLPDGAVVRSGAIVDPATAGNTNNTINRIQLQGEVPDSFTFSVLVDTTEGEHNPSRTIRARGNAGPDDLDTTQVEADTFPEDDALAFDGSPDVYTFRYDGFVSGDYLKLRLSGDPAPAQGASFGGLLFDVADDDAAPRPACETTPGAEEPPAGPRGSVGPGGAMPPPATMAPPARPVRAEADLTG